MQLYQTIERVYWSIFEPLDFTNLPTGNHMQSSIPLQMQAQMQQMQQIQQLPVDLISNPARYGSKAVRGWAERACRSLEFALNNNIDNTGGVDPELLAYPLYVLRAFYESLGATPTWENLGVGMGVDVDMMGVDGIAMGMGTSTSMDMDMGMDMNMGMNIDMNHQGMMTGGGMGSMSYSSGMENLNIFSTTPTTTTTAAMMMQQQQQQQQPQAPPLDGRLEVMWCDRFRERLKARGAEISSSIMGEGKKWREIAGFGY